MLKETATIEGFIPTLRKAYRKGASKAISHVNEPEAEFRPDVVLRPSIGLRLGPEIYEVEFTATNATISKSLMSLVKGLTDYPTSRASLVVPANKLGFAKARLAILANFVRVSRGKRRGAAPSLRLYLCSFEDVAKYHRKLLAWDESGRMGRPPKLESKSI